MQYGVLEPVELGESLGPVEQLTDRDDLIDFVIAIDTSVGIKTSREEAGRIIDVILKRDGSNTYFFGSRDQNRQMVATGRLTIRVDEAGEKHGFLSGLSVRVDKRGSGIGKKIVAIREVKAVELGCEYLDTETFCDNPQAIATKLHDGFVADRIVDDKKNNKKSFYMIRPIDRKKLPQTTGKKEEISLGDLHRLESLLSSGKWLVTGIKPLGEPKSSELYDWLLTVEEKVGASND